LLDNRKDIEENNMRIQNKIPILKGWTFEHELIVPCPFCRKSHRYGNVNYKKGEKTYRVPNCEHDSFQNICIEIQEEITKKELSKTEKCSNKYISLNLKYENFDDVKHLIGLR
jgi:hypothetical protein